MKKLFDIDLEKLLVTDWGYTEELEPKSYEHYDQWINLGLAGDLKYLTDHRKDLRKTLKNLWPKSQSALVFLFSYFDDKVAVDKYLAQHAQWNEKKISGYVFGFYGDDYHHVLMQNLMEIGEFLKKRFPNLEYKVAIDIHPNLDRDLAYRTGLGWFAKNSMLISKKHGSFTLIGSLVLNQKLELTTTKMETDHCGQCQKCIDSCPTSAITDQRTIDANKCISTFTIESFKEKERPKGFDSSSPWIFGCDICQDVCPWNKRILRQDLIKEKTLNAKQLSLLQFYLLRPVKHVLSDLKNMSKKEYLRKFARTSFERLGKNGMLKNLKTTIVGQFGVSLKEK